MALEDSLRGRLTEEGGQKYANIFKRAYTDLNVQGVQPEQLVQAGRTYTDAMLSAFLPEFNKQVGRDPTPEEINDFLDQNISVPMAASFIQGTNLGSGNKSLSQQFIDTNVSPQLEAEKAKQAQATFEQQAQENTKTQRSLLDQLAKIQEQQYVDRSNQEFGQSRGRLLSELAAAGRLRTPQATETLSRAEQDNNRALTQALSAIRASQVGQQLGVEQQGQQNIMQGRQFDVGTQQQNKGFRLQRQTLAEQIRQFNEGLAENQRQFSQAQALAQRLGQLRADSERQGWDDKVVKGTQALGSLLHGGASLYSAIK